MARFYVGIDISKRKHVACLRDLADDSFSKPFSFAVNRQGFAAFEAWLAERSTAADDFLIGVEATGPYGVTVSWFLLSLGYSVVELNPHQAAQFRRAQGRKAKTDRLDARSLATMLSLAHHKRLLEPDPIRDELRELTRWRYDLVKDRTALINALHETLTVLFPEFAALMNELNSPTVLALLASYPTPAALRQASIEAVTTVLRAASHGHFSHELANRLVEAATQTVGVPGRQGALQLKVCVLTERIQALNQAIDVVESQIGELFRCLGMDTDAFPVGGVTSLATLVAEIEDIGRFPSIKQFLSHFGWCPRTFQTGGYQSQHPKLSHAGNRYVRRVLWMLSVVAVRTVPRYRRYFEQRTAAGKNKMDSLVAVGRKLLSVVYAILKTGKPYDPDYSPPGTRLQPASA